MIYSDTHPISKLRTHLLKGAEFMLNGIISIANRQV